MALVNNKFTRQTDSFKSYLPFQPPTATFATNKLSDMAFINYIIPTESVKVNQIYGAETPLKFEVLVQNKTINVSLEFEVIYEKHFKISTSNKFVVGPTSQQIILVEVDNSYINTLSTTPVNKTNFKILVKNLSSELAYIPLQDTGLPRRSFNREITVE